MNGSTLVRAMPVGRRAAHLWDQIGGVRGVMVGALPVVLQVVSPQRPTASVIISVGYLVAALVVARPRREDVPVLIYAGVAFAFIALSMLRAEVIDPLTAAQRSYGLGKATYFILAIVPLSVAVALLISKAEDLRPVVVVFIVVGVALAVVSIPLRSNALLGATRYDVQGILVAIAGVLLSQRWILRDLRAVVPLVLVTVPGVAITESKQAVAVLVIGLAATTVYWFVADRYRAAAGRPGSFARTWAPPVIVFAGVVAVALAWILLVLQPWIPMPHVVRDPISCECIAGRFVTMVTQPGGRNELVVQGSALFAAHPILGAGLGSFVGLTAYPYPHNIVLELGGELGLVGIVLLLVPLVVAWVRLTLSSVRVATPALACVLALGLAYAIVANVSGDLASQRGFFVFGVIVLKLAWRRPAAEAPVT